MGTGYRLSGKEYTEAYTWGAGCSAWVLQQSDNVIIKEELMPSGTREQLHYHNRLEQFFFILEGEACFLIEGNEVVVPRGMGITIAKGFEHLIANKAKFKLRFLVISAPGIPNDRIDLIST